MFLTGLAGRLGWIELPAGLQVLEHPAVLGASGFMLLVEFCADKVPAVDSLWDIVHTLVRIPAGAALAAAVFGTDQATMAFAAALVGGTLAATSHVAKATTRAAVNASPEPLSNVLLSLLGDAIVPLALWLSWKHPWLLFGGLLVAVIAMVTLIVALGRFLLQMVRRVAGWFGYEGARASNSSVHRR